MHAAIQYLITHQQQEWCVDAQKSQRNRQQHYLHGSALQGGELKERRAIILDLVLLFVFILYLPLLRLEMENGPPLRMVQGSGPVESAQEKGYGKKASDGLKAKTPTQGTKQKIMWDYKDQPGKHD